MPESTENVMCFDRFTLDLRRGCLRDGTSPIDLRPKTFMVLRHLLENDGRLIPKRELLDVVWPGIAVSDDSLAQCIRELRNKLGDKDHRLIRTVNRRGYLLDAEVSVLATNFTPVGAGASPIERPADPVRRYTVSANVTLSPRPAPVRNKLFSDDDARRIAQIARDKQLPLPKIEMGTPDDDVPLDVRRFVGVWVSTKGFVHTNRQFMLIVNHVEKEGLVGGYTVRGPPTPNSRLQNPAEAVTFTAHISDGALIYSNPRGSYRVWFTKSNSLIFQQTYVTAHVTMVALQPVWTLLEAERAADARGGE